MRVTDLEKFFKYHVKNPYLNSLPNMEIAEQMSLKNVMRYIEKYPQWWALVEDRIKRIGFTFPTWIKHDLVNLLTDQKEG